MEQEQGRAADAPPATDLVGRVLAGRYRILEKLGEGAMGAVYLGEHLRMGRRDAIKVLRGPLASDAEAIRRFNRGARNVSAVRHPNVCTIYDFSDTEEGVTFLAMELIAGESLKELLERERLLPPGRALTIARQVAHALQAAHDAGIVHRDLKPANIMLMRDRDGGDVVKVVDFDIAKGVDEVEGTEVTRVGFVVGTPEYMSPEQLMGERLDGRSDLYSLGLVLFRMLTGSLPFRADSPQDLMILRLTQRPLRLEEAAPGTEFSAELQSAIDRALATRPADRQACAADLARELDAAAGVPATVTTRAPAPASAAMTASGAATSAPPAGGFRTAVGGTLAPTLVGAPAVTEAAPPPALSGSRLRTPALVVLGLLVLGAGGAWWVRRPAAGAARRVAAGVTNEIRPSPAAPAPGPQSTPAPPSAAAPSITPPARGEAAARKAPDEPATVPPVHAAPAASALLVTAADRSDMLWRQNDRLGPPLPPMNQLLAIRDTARMVWDQADAPEKLRALAAYVLANTWVATGQASRVLLWARRAVDLDSANAGYRTLFDQYRRARP